MTALLTQLTPAHPPARLSLPIWPDNLPPVILLGGGANALSVARQLGRLGAPIHALAEPGAFVAHSRYCRAIESGRTGERRVRCTPRHGSGRREESGSGEDGRDELTVHEAG